MLRDLFSRLPTKEEIEDLAKPVAYTPDLWKLEQRPRQLVFEYGELLLGLPKHRMLDTLPDALGYTTEKLSLWRKNDGVNSKAIALNGCSPDGKKTRVQGQLYVLATEKVKKLDFYRKNGVLFTRRQVPIELHIGGTVRAWMWIGCKDAWAEEITWDQTFFRSNGGSHFHRAEVFPDQRDWNRDYYRFTEKDIQKDCVPLDDPLRYFYTKKGPLFPDVQTTPK